MVEFGKIWAHARYEMITLLRGWFFRIFAGMTIGIFLTINIIFFSGAVPFVPRIFYGFSASVPYANMLMLNIAQIAVIIFMATDFFKRDLKFNTTEVFFIRSMSNSNYLFGKALGVFILFAALNLIVLIMAMIIHLVFSEISFNWYPYLLYPLFICLPSFIYMIGLSFIFMHLLKNQAIVVLTLLGYYAVVLFYLYDKVYYVFDFVTIKIPLAYSDFTGFGHLDLLLLQRGIYFSLGIAGILASILIFKRLAQSVALRRIIFSCLLIFSGLALYCIFKYLNFYTDHQQMRTEMGQLNNRYSSKPELTALSCQIEIDHQGANIRGTTRYLLQNNSDSLVDSFLFSINPGLLVSSVKQAGLSLDFTQQLHILQIKAIKPLNPGATDSIRIHYSGKINESVGYLEIDDSELHQPFTFWLYKSTRRYAFLQDDYVLLPPGCLWYPRPGLPPGANFLKRSGRSFIPFQLDVRTLPELTVLSQGEMQIISEGHIRFQSDNPLPEISLIAGQYTKSSVRVDSIDYQFYHLHGHDYYKNYFSQVGDTLRDVLQELSRDYEVRLNLAYPYKRLSLIEVPLQYYVYPRIWTVAQEVVLPEQIWFQENGASIPTADFGRLERSMERRLDRSNQTMTEQETQIAILKTFLNSTFAGKVMRGLWVGGPDSDYKPDYNLFPNYYTYVTYLDSDQWPVLNTALEAFLSDRVHEADETVPIWRMEGLTSAEEVSQALIDKSLADHLQSMEKKLLLPEMIKQKGAFLIKKLQSEMGQKSFNHYLGQTINQSRYKVLTYDKFFQDLPLSGTFDVEEFLRSWYYDEALPAYLVSRVRFYKVYDRDRIRTQVLFDIANTEPTDGLFEVSFQYSRRGMGFGMGAAYEEVVPTIHRLNAGQSKRIGLLLDEEPRSVDINFLLARNLPLIYSERFEKAELEERTQPVEGEQRLVQQNVYSKSEEIIIDNLDDHFQVYNPPFNSMIKRWIQGNDQDTTTLYYDRFQWWNPPHQWRLIKSATFFGTYIHSAYYIRPGDGSKYVSWTTQLDEPGIYDIYTYMFNKEDFQRRRRGRRTQQFGDFNYIVYHQGGEELISFSVDQATDGWNLLGSWYLTEGTAAVKLTDETSARFVIADAIKWIKN